MNIYNDDYSGNDREYEINPAFDVYTGYTIEEFCEDCITYDKEKHHCPYWELSLPFITRIHSEPYRCPHYNCDNPKHICTRCRHMANMEYVECKCCNSLIVDDDGLTESTKPYRMWWDYNWTKEYEDWVDLIRERAKDIYQFLLKPI